jgi:hypothetical protein
MLNDSWLMDTWRASKRGHSWLPTINKAPPPLISHLFLVQGYSTQISPLLSILSHSSLSFFSQACGKYLSKLASNTRNLWRIHGVESVLGAILFDEVICSSLFLAFICCRFRVGIPNKIFCLGRTFGSIIIDLVSISCRFKKIFCFIT